MYQNVDITLWRRDLIDILTFLLTAHGTSDPSRPFCGVIEKELESHGQAPLKSGDKSGVCLCEHILLKCNAWNPNIYGTLENPLIRRFQLWKGTISFSFGIAQRWATTRCPK